MPKKDFKRAADNNPALAFLSTQPPTVHNIQPVHDKDGVQPVHTTKKPAKYCNINLRLRQDLKDYLGDESWRTRTTMTQYISDLIEADMRAKQESAGENNV